MVEKQLKTILLVSHMPTANTSRLTGAVASGARDPSIETIDIRVTAPLETGPDEVLAADAIILGTTENFGYMSGAMKDFFDRIYYPCLEHTEAIPYALFIRAGLDGLGAQSSIERIVTGLKWKAIQQPLICKGDIEQFIEPCKELGALMAAGLAEGIF